MSKANFKDNGMYNPTPEDQLFKPSLIKNLDLVKTIPQKRTQKQPKMLQKQKSKKKKSYNNVTNGERTALKELLDLNDVVITRADKGGAIIIINMKDYVKEVEHPLSNKESYKKHQHDPRQIHPRLVNDTINVSKMIN